jgi:hypothetical protein
LKEILAESRNERVPVSMNYYEYDLDNSIFYLKKFLFFKLFLGINSLKFLSHLFSSE